MFLRTTIVILYGLFLSGCVSWYDSVASMSSEELKKVDDLKLCSSYFYRNEEKVAAEITRRNLINNEGWKSVRHRKIIPGMSRCAVYAVLGSPRIETRKAIDGQNTLEIISFSTVPGSSDPSYRSPIRTHIRLTNGVVTNIE